MYAYVCMQRTPRNSQPKPPHFCKNTGLSKDIGLYFARVVTRRKGNPTTTAKGCQDAATDSLMFSALVNQPAKALLEGTDFYVFGFELLVFLGFIRYYVFSYLILM